MRPALTFMLLIAMGPIPIAQRVPFGPGDTVRAAYLASNPAQATKDPKTGELRGVVIDLTRELGRLRGVTMTLIGLPNPQAVIDAVARGDADIGFVAYNPERAGPVEFSKPYMLVHQTFLVSADSPIRSIADVDRAGGTLGATRADSIALYLRRTLKQGKLLELDDTRPETVLRLIRDGEIDAFGANRQRLTDLSRNAGGVRLLPDDLYGVEQSIIAPASRQDVIGVLNTFIDDVRRSGALRQAIERSGVVGITAAGDPTRK
jgi:polar amino acid transport system substrate-binding protein